MSWWSSDDEPGSKRPCQCFTVLELLEQYPDGPIEPLFTGDGYGATIGHLLQRWRWCPGCGGRLGRYTDAVLAARAAFLAARDDSYAPVRELREVEAIAAFCDQRGAIGGAGEYQRAWVDAARSLRVTATWDPDHERWYASTEFAPGDALRRQPFVAGTTGA